MQVHAFDSIREMPSLDEQALGSWRAFLTAHALITRRISQDLVRGGLPDLSWYDVLWVLYREPDRRLRINELAREVVLSPTGMSRFVDRMEAAGAVRRESVPGDRRAFHIVITGQGIDLLRRMWPIYADGIDRHFACYLEDNTVVVREML